MKLVASNWWVFFVPVMMMISAAQTNNFGNETDRNALLEFKNAITEDPNGVFNSWNDSQHHCLWEGITCDARHGRVISLALGGNSILEYGMGGKASIQGDTYSYGILLLEMFTGIRPTDERFVEGLDLHKYVQMNLAQVMKVVDPFLFSTERADNGNENAHEIFASIFNIGLNCSEVLPNERMNIDVVLRQLRLIKNKVSILSS